ncbi:hypothetical protein EGW08_016535 [Elysia chlorotica]|uniref:BTB domain-containing protein n=1 Tax=Elysia chlorotica TaxID=188477 RepID=A0A3S0ZED3_ELYCH|nr:hypothetical protein EGW08_016535 [Elysia chlorotica]
MPLEKDCTSKCRSRQHVGSIISLLTSPSSTLLQFRAYSALCNSTLRWADDYGRTALHLAASCGHSDVVQWLLEEGHADLGIKDAESGHTALHRALFYGQLACARVLLQFHSDMHARDTEALSPLDLVMLDKPAAITYGEKEPNEVYTWGENYNSTLGHTSPHKRASPEVVDHFKKMGVSIKQLVLCKYHTVFLSLSGQVYTCGHGQGGRLGHGDQHTVLVPRMLDCLKDQTCLEMAAATDHTVLRMEGSIVYSFGINSYHQLGQTPYVENSPQPKQMNLKPLKGKSISGVCVGRFHSVVWTPDSVFTVGLNAGQLGVPRGEKYLSQLRQVSSLRHTEIGVSLVACSDAATVCLTTKGDVYVLHEYQCRKIASKWQEIEQVIVSGGNLDHNTGLDILREKGGHELNIALRNEGGQLFLWRSSSPSVKRCQFALRRQLAVRDIAMTTSSLVFSTERGEAFVGYFSNKKSGMSSKDQEHKHAKEVRDHGDGFNQPRLLDLLLREEVEEVQVRRLPGIHRATLVACDRKARNFAVLQALPNGCMSELPAVTNSNIQDQFKRLLYEADLGDSIHDVVVEAGNKSWPAHKYILAMRSDFFRNTVLALEASSERAMMEKQPVVKVPGVDADMMEQILNYIYSDTCDFLTPGHKVKFKSDPGAHVKHLQSTENFDAKGMSAFQVQQKRQTAKEQNNKKSHSKQNIQDDHDSVNPLGSQNLLQQFQEVARKLGVKGLSKRLDAVKCVNGVIVSQNKRLTHAKIRFDSTKLPELFDVTIKSEDGQERQCHKCVLVSRLEYFYSMLATGWLESSGTTTLTLEVPGQVMDILLQFLYTDEAPQLMDSFKEDLLCNLLIVSDQLLVTRLKEMCEVALANILSFKNAGELLEFSSVYQAHQLKAACQQFISLNLAAMLENRYLDVLSEDTLEELGSYYRASIPSMAYRHMTPAWTGSQAVLDLALAEFKSGDNSFICGDDSMNSGRKSNKQQQQKKRTKAQRRQSEESDKTKTSMSTEKPAPSRLGRNLSVSSDRSGLSEDDSFAELLEEIQKQQAAEEKQTSQTAAQAKSREKLKWKPLDQQQKLRLPGPIQPENVPHLVSNMKTLAWTKGQNVLQDNQKGLQSPGPTVGLTDPSSPPARNALSMSALSSDAASLRDIMRQESQDSDKRKSSLSAGHRVSWKDVKKQQSKEAKEKQQEQQRTSQAQSREDIKQSGGPSPKAGANPWAPIGSMIKSFKDLMVQDEISKTTEPMNIPQARTPRSIQVAQSPSPGASGRTRMMSWGSPPTSPGSGADNPWQRRGAEAQATAIAAQQHSPAFVALNFSAILRDEEEKTETLVRATQKPLALIQLEERAMSELLSHYQAKRSIGADLHDRHISVERVSKAMAAPVWKRERTTSSSGHYQL